MGDCFSISGLINPGGLGFQQPQVHTTLRPDVKVLCIRIDQGQPMRSYPQG
jgi:hypothetical protein